MNVGIVTTWFERGAAYVSKQYMDILNEKYNIFIYARSGESYASEDPNWALPNVYWSKKINSPFVVTVIDKNEFINWIKKNNISSIIFNEQHWWPPLLWCKELDIKTIAYIDYYTEKTIPLFGIYDLLLCNTLKHYNTFKWHSGAKYLPWGTNVELFKPSSDSKVSDKLIFFHSCGMNPLRKGTDLLLKALQMVRSTDFKLIIHTQTSLEMFFPELKNDIKELIHKGKLEIIEKTVKAPGLYHLGDIYVYPSRLEGIGLTIAEAIASGLGVIVPNCGPMNEFVSDEFAKTVKVKKLFARHDGYYWPQNEVSVPDLAEQLSSFIEIKKEIKTIKHNARFYALDKLNWKKNASVLNEIIEKQVGKSNKIQLEKAKDKIIQFENTGLRKYNKYFLIAPILFKIIKK